MEQLRKFNKNKVLAQTTLLVGGPPRHQNKWGKQALHRRLLGTGSLRNPSPLQAHFHNKLLLMRNTNLASDFLISFSCVEISSSCFFDGWSKFFVLVLVPIDDVDNIDSSF